MNEFFKGTVTRRDWMYVSCIAGGALGICALYYFAFHDGQLSKIREYDEQIAVLERNIKLAQAMEANIDQLREESRKYTTLVAEFEKRLPQGAEIPRLLQEFERIANEAGVSVELSTLPRNSDQRKEEIPYTVLAKGNFHQVTDFINRLERYERYLKVSKMNISEEKQGVCTAKFTLSTYRFITPDAANKAASPAAPDASAPAPAAGKTT
jgi:Tfp pilus assembly protein PilO